MTAKRKVENLVSEGAASSDAPLQSVFFSAVNTLTEPAVRAGLGSLWFLPSGMIVLETTGRHSGTLRRVTLLAAEVGDHVVVSTLRVRGSQWLRNVMAKPHVRYWVRGQPHDAVAVAILPDDDKPRVNDTDLQCIVDTLHRQATVCGAAFVTLTPHAR